MQENSLIEAFKRRLQSDPKLRAEFLEAPLGVMRREGVQVSPAEAMRLRNMMAAAVSREGQ